jgi:hypothetical protein
VIETIFEVQLKMFLIVEIRECSGEENPPDEGREISQQFPGKSGSYTV